MQSLDWLLLAVEGHAVGATGPDKLDPVRIQKSMFLLSQRGPARDLYSFKPYNWGPFSSSIYNDLDSLVLQGLLEKVPNPGHTWVWYEATPKGHDRASQLALGLKDEQRTWLGRCRDFVTDRSFTRLLRDVYDAYPEMATKSLFQS